MAGTPNGWIWITEVQQDENGDYTVYINPEGERFDSLQFAHDAVQQANSNSAETQTRYMPCAVSLMSSKRVTVWSQPMLLWTV